MPVIQHSRRESQAVGTALHSHVAYDEVRLSLLLSGSTGERERLVRVSNGSAGHLCLLKSKVCRDECTGGDRDGKEGVDVALEQPDAYRDYGDHDQRPAFLQLI